MENKWIFNNKHRQTNGYKLFCIPYAGAGATIFSRWQKLMGKEIDILPVQLPGRENRIDEPCVKDAKELANMILDGIRNELGEHFSIFGHSMGGIIAYELTILIEKKLQLSPDILFMSATTLQKRPQNKFVSNITDEELGQYLARTGGTSLELLDSDIFRETYFPIIRNDYGLVEKYECDYQMTSARVRAFASKDDCEIDYRETENIKMVSKDFKISYFEGGHFYIQSDTAELIKKIKKEILLNCF